MAQSTRFPHKMPVVFFRALRQLHALPRLVPVTYLPALGAGYRLPSFFIVSLLNLKFALIGY